MNVKIARIKMGFTQKQLAKISGISNVTIGKIEQGNYNNITKSTMVKLAKALNSTVQELFFDE